ncbi:hypothetical protein YC2023_038694 [Brassica napus]
MEKKKVQWVDLMGKELAEIHEFKSRLKMISDMMGIKAVFASLCDQLSLVLPGDKAMVKGEEASPVRLVALALESIYIEVVHIVESAVVFTSQSTFASLRLHDDSKYNLSAFRYGFRILKIIAFYYTCFFDQL